MSPLVTCLESSFPPLIMYSPISFIIFKIVKYIKLHALLTISLLGGLALLPYDTDAHGRHPSKKARAPRWV